MFQTFSVNEVKAIYRASKPRPRSGDELELEVPLTINKSKGALWVLVILPAKYPYQAPLIQVIKAKVVHKHLDSHMRVTHPLLDSWTNKSSLLDVIRTIHQEFNNSPPQLDKGQAKAEEAKQKGTGTFIQKPDMEAIKEQLSELSQSEMETLINDDTFFEDYFNNLKGVKELGENFAKIMGGLKVQAEENIKNKEKIDEEISQHEELYEEYETTRKQFEKLKEKEQKIMSNLSKDNISSALRERKAGFEDEEKQIIDQFKEGSLDFDDYVCSYRKNREQIAKYNFIGQKLTN